MIRLASRSSVESVGVIGLGPPPPRGLLAAQVAEAAGWQCRIDIDPTRVPSALPLLGVTVQREKALIHSVFTTIRGSTLS